MRNLNNNQRDSKSPADRIAMDSWIITCSMLIPTNLCFPDCKGEGQAKITFCNMENVALTSHSTMAILSSSSAMNISFCATFALKVSTCRIVCLFVCFIIKTIMVSWFLVLVHFVYMEYSLLPEETSLPPLSWPWPSSVERTPCHWGALFSLAVLLLPLSAARTWEETCGLWEIYNTCNKILK